MKEFIFENQGTNTYLVYTVGENESLDSMTLGMLTNNKIPGLAPVLFTQMDATKFIKYNVSAKVSAKQFFTGPVNRKRLVGVLSGIIDALMSADDYMIDANSVLLDMDYIFTDVSTCETILICLPLADAIEGNSEVSQFFKNIIFSTQFDQTENCDHVAKIINFLNSSPMVPLQEFKNLLDSIDGKVKSQPTPAAEHKTEPPNRIAKTPTIKPAQPQPPVSSPSQPPVVAPAIPLAPVQPIASPATGTPSPQSVTDQEEKMTLMYLMRHYSKENAAKYKIQKGDDKTKEQSNDKGKHKKTKEKDKDKNNNKKDSIPPNVGFQVPGAPQVPNAEFAIPGVPPVQSAVLQSTVPAPAQTPAYVPPSTSVQPPVKASVPQGAQQQMSTGIANFGETTILGGGTSKFGETTVLGVGLTVQQTLRPFLIRLKNNEKIPIDKPVYRIGKERSYVDYFIGDNPAISRSHANIIAKDALYYIVDTNSTNHTYVNGEMILPNMEVQITPGTKIRLGNEEFEFKEMV